MVGEFSRERERLREKSRVKLARVVRYGDRDKESPNRLERD